MTPDSYLDIRLLGEKATDLALPVIGNQVFHVLHGAFRQSPGQYALALPDCKPGKSSSIGNKLRIFGRRDDLMILLDGFHP
jgi:CRISPR-associated protein (Cas_Csy4)